jgi:pyruvate kinase
VASIAAATEAAWADRAMRRVLPGAFARIAVSVEEADAPTVEEVIAYGVATAVDKLKARIVLAPSVSGETARAVAAYRLPCWVLAISPNAATCQRLNFASGVFPIEMSDDGLSWEPVAEAALNRNGITEGLAVITHRWRRGRTVASNRIEILDLKGFVGSEF